MTSDTEASATCWAVAARMSSARLVTYSPQIQSLRTRQPSSAAGTRRSTRGRYRRRGRDPAGGGRQDVRRRDRRRGRAHPRRGDGRGVRAGRPVRVRQDDDAQDDQPADRADQRADPARRRGRHPRRPGRLASADGVRDPARRPLPPPHGGAEHRHRARAARLGPRPGARPHRGAAGPGRAEPRGVRRAIPAVAVRRSAAKGRRGPGAGGRSPGPAHGRAVRRGRPAGPRPAAAGVPAAAAGDRQDRRPGHPRRRGGGTARRPDRGALRGRAAGAARPSSRGPGRARHRRSWPASSAATAASSGWR